MCWRQHELSTAAVRLLDEERVRRNEPPLFAQATEVELTNVWHIFIYINDNCGFTTNAACRS